MSTTAAKIQEEVVQVVRSIKTPADELDLALEMSKGRLPSIMPFEEKKEDDPPMPSARHSDAFVEEKEQPSEEGQEALWVDDVKDLPKGSDHTGNASPSATPSRRWKIPSPTRSPSRINKTNSLQDHVYLLPNKEHPVKPSPLDLVQVKNKDELKKKKEAAVKVKTARELLEQALSPHANLGSRDLLAQAAFEHATEARHLVEAAVTPELETLIKDAKEKGKTEVAKMRQLQLQETNTATAVATAAAQDEIPATKSEESQDDHASRARNLLEFILPEVDPVDALPQTASSSPKPQKPKSPDDVSTLGFDNTYVAKGASKDFDILSMSSLNEILDGPLDEDPNFPVLKHRIIHEEENENGETTEAAKKAKRASLFGGMFRPKHKEPTAADTSNVNESTAPENNVKESTNNLGKESALNKEEKKNPKKEKAEKNASKPVSKETRRSRKKKFGANKKDKEQKSSLVTMVLIDDGPTHPNGFEDTQCEITNTDELERIKSIDARLNKTLKEAIDTDDAESLTSYNGVALHGESGDEKEKKDKKKRKGAKKAHEEEKRRTPPRQFDKLKPQFMAAPRGDPAILTSKSWESIASENEKEQVAGVAAARKEEPEEDVEDHNQEEKIQVPDDVSSSPGSSAADSAGDRYVIASDRQALEDRYMVANDEASFEAFLDPCGSSKQLTIVQANDTCSTLGMAAASCLSGQTAAIEAEEFEAPDPVVDKYAATPAAETAQTEDEDKSLENIKPSNGEKATTSTVATNGIEGNGESAETLTAAKSQTNTWSRTKKVNSTTAEKPATKKRLKMRGFGIFGARKANTAPRKSRSTTPTKTTPTRLTSEQTKRSTPRKLLRSKRQNQDTGNEDTLVQQTKISVVTEALPATNDVVAKSGKEATVLSPENTVVESDAGGEHPKTDVVADDPLVAHIKNQMSRTSNRGLDPSTAEEEAACKGLDP